MGFVQVLRFPRPYGKKRGDRRSVSSRRGRAWLAIFSALFLLAGGISLAFITFQWTLPEWRVNRRYVEHVCRVVDKRIESIVNDDGATLYRPGVRVRYELHGEEYAPWTFDAIRVYSQDLTASERALEDFEIGQECPCWYDPGAHDQVVLRRGYTWFAWLMLLIPASFLAIGGGGMAYTMLNWGVSTERRAVLAQQAARLDPLRPSGSSEGTLPTIPSLEHLTNSRGTTLRFRLPFANPRWGGIALVIGCLVTNAAAIWIIVDVIGGSSRGGILVGEVAAMVALVVAGVVFDVFLARHLMRALGVPATIVEVSQHPLLPGREYEAYVSQTGKLKVNSFRVTLVCEEEATYSQGTDTRVEKCRVHEREVLRREQITITPRAPLEERFSFFVPAGAMHSFQSNRNAISWKLVVDGDIARWPNFRFEYLVYVYPLKSTRESHEPRSMEHGSVFG